MKYIPQFAIILLFSFLGELLQALISLPVPSAVYGMLLLLLALATGIVKEEKVSAASSFLVSIIPLLFVAPAAKLLQYWDVIGPDAVAICIILVASTLAVFAVSGLVTKWLQKRKGEKDNG
ncbi:MAG: CidA/LrgA family protein [Oscillospiraceae bacterium]|nr:CidA/LrgA family protein [Oscillospiraceae bacterium]